MKHQNAIDFLIRYAERRVDDAKIAGAANNKEAQEKAWKDINGIELAIKALKNS